MRVIAVASMVVTLSACGPGVRSIADVGEPLVVLKGEVVTEAPAGTPTSDLAASLVWAALGPEVVTCLASATTATQALDCTGSDFSPRRSSRTVPLKPVFPSSLELPLFALPEPSTLDGVEGARLSYALVVVHHDGNRNGTLDLIPPTELEGPDTVLGTSLRAGSPNQGELLVYREGALSAAWNAFRLVAGCAEPPQGFSIARWSRNEVGALACELLPADTTVRIELSASASVRERACMSAPPPVSQKPPVSAPIGTIRCFGTSSVDVDPAPTATCRRLERYDLVGCPNGMPGCAGPAWDVSATPPTWWPCDTSGPNATLQLIPEPGPFTPKNPEPLFRIEAKKVVGKYRPQDLRLSVVFDEMGSVARYSMPDPRVISGRIPFRFEDRDNDNLVGQGDALTLEEDQVEPRKLDFDGPVVARFPVNLSVVSKGATLPLGAALTWEPTPVPGARTDLGFTLADAPNGLTAAADCLFTVTAGAGNDALRVKDLEVEISRQGTVAATFRGASLSLDDTNGDGAFGPGEVLRVCEAAASAPFGTTANAVPHAVTLRQHVGVFVWRALHAPALEWLSP